MRTVMWLRDFSEWHQRIESDLVRENHRVTRNLWWFHRPGGAGGKCPRRSWGRPVRICMYQGPCTMAETDNLWIGSTQFWEEVSGTHFGMVQAERTRGNVEAPQDGTWSVTRTGIWHVFVEWLTEHALAWLPWNDQYRLDSPKEEITWERKW